MVDSSADKAVGKGSTPGSSKLRLSSRSPKHVYLFDWWLIKADSPFDGKRLGVGGLCTQDKQGIRAFHSAAIIKRHNNNVVETADGFTITVTGSINKPHTVQNGLPPEVCNLFLLGFPYNWEEFASQSFAEESTNRPVSQGLSNCAVFGVSSADGSKSFLPNSFDDVPGVLLRDFVSTLEISGSCNLGESIFDDVLQTYCASTLTHKGQVVSPNKESDHVMTMDSAEDEICSKHKKSKIERKHKGEDDVSGAKSGKVKLQEMNREANDLSSRPSTRSMSRLKIAMDKQEENILNTRKMVLRNRSIDLHVKGMS